MTNTSDLIESTTNEIESAEAEFSDIKANVGNLIAQSPEVRKYLALMELMEQMEGDIVTKKRILLDLNYSKRLDEWVNKTI
jgi:hypothetical protein